MTGDAFIIGSAGWACSNMADYSSVPERGPDNKFKYRQDLKLISIFGHAEKNTEVECLFRPDDGKGEVIGLKGFIRGVSDKTVYVSITGKAENIKEIYTKIKGGK